MKYVWFLALSACSRSVSLKIPEFKHPPGYRVFCEMGLESPKIKQCYGILYHIEELLEGQEEIALP